MALTCGAAGTYFAPSSPVLENSSTSENTGRTFLPLQAKGEGVLANTRLRQKLLQLFRGSSSFQKSAGSAQKPKGGTCDQSMPDCKCCSRELLHGATFVTACIPYNQVLEQHLLLCMFAGIWFRISVAIHCRNKASDS